MRVLIVDDSPAMRLVVRRTLRQAGFGDLQFSEATDGLEALAVIRERTPDLVLSDWYMPRMSGFKLLNTLRSEGRHVPFAFVTTESSGEVRSQAAAAGALFLLAKPFTGEQLRAALAPHVQ